MQQVTNMTQSDHTELAKHLPSDFFKRKITGEEFMRLLAEIKGSVDPAIKLMEFLKRHGFEVEK